jgi:hypothetical protein
MGKRQVMPRYGFRELGYQMYEINDERIAAMLEAPEKWPKQLNAFFCPEGSENYVF